MMFCAYRFPSRETFRALVAAEGLTTDDDSLITDSHTHSLVELGVLAVDGIDLPGWHVNTLELAPETWDEFLVIVNHPRNVFAGGPTCAPDTATLEAIVS